ncbi:hypothetical protein ACQB60_07545 [Actinomycetota bacterium Odt1-20B]
MDVGADHLAGADRDWLLAAAAATLATWLCAAITQQGAVAERLPAWRLVAAQFAACAANHVLPEGDGAGLVNLRFLTRCGLSTTRSATALAVKAAVGGPVRFALAILLLLASPRVSPVPLSRRGLSAALSSPPWPWSCAGPCAAGCGRRADRCLPTYGPCTASRPGSAPCGEARSASPSCMPPC